MGDPVLCCVIQKHGEAALNVPGEHAMLVTSVPIRGCRLTIDPVGWVNHVTEGGLHGEITNNFIFNIMVIGVCKASYQKFIKAKYAALTLHFHEPDNLLTAHTFARPSHQLQVGAQPSPR